MRRAAAPLLAIAVAAACAAPSPPLLPGPPRRIVSLAPALTEVLFSLGLGDRVVGVTDYCDRPVEARTRPKVGGYSNPSIESILSLRPDLVVVTPGPGNRAAVLAVERAGIAVAVFHAETLAETLDVVAAVGERCGAPERGRELTESLRARLDAVARRVAGRRRPRVLFVLQTDPIIAAGLGTLPSDLLAVAGGDNVVGTSRYPRLGVEWVLEARPEVIIQSRMDSPAGAGPSVETRFWERWPELPAVHDGRVRLLDGDAALRAGPRVAEAAEQLSVLLAEGDHP